MSSPAREIEVVCKGCGTTYLAPFYRPSINLTTEPGSEAEIRRATTATCPDCNLEVQLTALLVDGGEFRLLDNSEK